MITPIQCREARTLLGWSQPKLALRVGVPSAKLAAFERGTGRLDRKTRDDLQLLFEVLGVEFTNGGEPGVKMKQQT